MTDPAFAGHCLNCGEPCYGQSECDACSKDWDGCWDCPECGDHTENVVDREKPLQDCLDHTEDGDLDARKTIRKLRAENEKERFIARELRRKIGFYEQLEEAAIRRVERLEAMRRKTAESMADLAKKLNLKTGRSTSPASALEAEEDRVG